MTKMDLTVIEKSIILFCGVVLILLLSISLQVNSKPDYSESDYDYDDELDMFHTVKSPSIHALAKEFKYGPYEAVMSGHHLNVQLDDQDYFGDYDDQEFDDDDEADDEDDPDYEDYSFFD